MMYHTRKNHNFFAVYKNDCNPLIGYTHKKRINNWLETQTQHPKDKIEIISRDTMDARGNKDVTCYNPFTGKNIVLKARDAGGPCDPTTERYHCM